MDKRVAVIILNWNGERLLREFLPSVTRWTPGEWARVVVADNGSTDGSVALLEREFPGVERLLLGSNYGFAGGYNRAVEAVEAEYVVLLNSDVEVTPGWLEPLVAALDGDAGVAAVQPKVRAYRDRERFEYAGACGGYVDGWGFPFCRGRVLGTTERDEGQYDAVAEVFWTTGAAMCARREAYLEAGGLDEGFFAHMEEIDLCWRWGRAGWRLLAVPGSVVFHLGGGSLEMGNPRKVYLNYRNNLLMLHKNMERGECRRVLRGRWWMDAAAWGMFVATGRWRSAGAVWRAWRDFRRERGRYAPVAGGRRPGGWYGGSVVWGYYARGWRRFSDFIF